MNTYVVSAIVAGVAIAILFSATVWRKLFTEPVAEEPPPAPKWEPSVWTAEGRYTVRPRDEEPTLYDTETEACAVVNRLMTSSRSEWVEAGPIALRRDDVISFGAYKVRTFTLRAI